ncbi:MAG TPA: isoprenyl transferase [Anaerolineae bacterium]|nr:isoprenyl transferase [Anaerolineae bacterium]
MVESAPLPAVPYHLAIIMDGNGRWAQARRLPRLAGHRAGTENLRRVLRACKDFGVKILTVYAFSTENWRRPAEEVSGLMTILDEYIVREMRALHEEGVQIRHLGRMDGVRPGLQEKIKQAIELTRNNTTLILNVAFNYGGRQEILDAVRAILADGVAPEDVDEALFSRYLYTAGQPDPDLIIRTSGEARISNFLLWQGAYAELYSTPVFWPDFDKHELRKALDHYANRERRFGLTTAQLATVR